MQLRIIRLIPWLRFDRVPNPGLGGDTVIHDRWLNKERTRWRARDGGARYSEWDDVDEMWWDQHRWLRLAAAVSRVDVMWRGIVTAIPLAAAIAALLAFLFGIESLDVS